MERVVVVTSEIKCTDRYCYNKERKTWIGDFLSILFDNKKTTTFARGYNCMEKAHKYQTIFNEH